MEPTVYTSRDEVDIPTRLAIRSGRGLERAAPKVVQMSPTWCAMEDAEKRLFLAIFEEFRGQAEGFRTDEEIYTWADIQFGILMGGPADEERTSKDEEVRLKKQKVMLEQMEKLRKDKGETAEGIAQITEAMMAVRGKDGRVRAWMVEFADDKDLKVETEANEYD